MLNGRSAGLLSVIIPNYNYDRFIADAIASVVHQDYGPVELIVVDDASTDRSVAVIERALGNTNGLKRTELVALDANVGKLGAINRALGRIHGDYSIILDSDDLLAPNYASRCITELAAARQTDRQLGFIYSDCNLITEDGQPLARGQSTAFDADLLEELSYVPEPAVVLTEAMIEAGPFDESIRRGTKHHKWRRIVANGWHGKHIAEPLFSYRMHGNNLSGIGRRVLDEVESGRRGHRILSGYWPTEAQKETAP